MRDAGSAGQREGRRAGWTGVFWVGVFEVCIFPLAACNYSAPGCRMQQLQTALIRFGHRSGFPDRDVRPIPDQSRIRQKFPFQARKATLVNYGVAQYTELGKGTCHLRHGVQSDPPYVSSPLLPCSHPVLPHRFSAAQMRHLLQLDYDATQRALDSDDTRPPVPAPRRPRGLVHPDTQYQQPSSTTSFISMYSSVDAFHTPCRYHLLLHAADSSSREITGSRSVAFIPTINHQECLQASIVFRLWFLPVAHDNEFFPPSPCARDLIAAICQSNPWLHPETFPRRHPNPNRPPANCA